MARSSAKIGQGESQEHKREMLTLYVATNSFRSARLELLWLLCCSVAFDAEAEPPAKGVLWDIISHSSPDFYLAMHTTESEAEMASAVKPFCAMDVSILLLVSLISMYEESKTSLSGVNSWRSVRPSVEVFSFGLN